MKTKETTVDSKTFTLENVPTKTKPKSLRPMRSMVAVRSLKPKTVVTSFTLEKTTETRERL
jgi:hypothetical protein